MTHLYSIQPWVKPIHPRHDHSIATFYTDPHRYKTTESTGTRPQTRRERSDSVDRIADWDEIPYLEHRDLLALSQKWERLSVMRNRLLVRHLLFIFYYVFMTNLALLVAWPSSNAISEGSEGNLCRRRHHVTNFYHRNMAYCFRISASAKQYYFEIFPRTW